jgi:hypothetical protein
LDDERLISLKDAAALFGLSQSHLRLLARTGKVQAQRMGRDWFTTSAAVAAYLNDPNWRHRTRHQPPS